MTQFPEGFGPPSIQILEVEIARQFTCVGGRDILTGDVCSIIDQAGYEQKIYVRDPKKRDLLATILELLKTNDGELNELAKVNRLGKILRGIANGNNVIKPLPNEDED